MWPVGGDMLVLVPFRGAARDIVTDSSGSTPDTGDAGGYVCEQDPTN